MAAPAAVQLTAADILEAAPPAAVAALAESLGVPAEGLAELLPPEDLAAALETVQLHVMEHEGQQAQQAQPGQGQALHEAGHEQWQQQSPQQQQQQAASEAVAMPAPLPVLPATAAASTALPVVGPADGNAGAAAMESAGEAGGHSDMRVVGGDGSWVCE